MAEITQEDMRVASWRMQNLLLAITEKGGKAGANTPLITFKKVTTAIEEGINPHAELLKETPTPYIKATVYAMTGAVGATNVPVANTGVVYIMTGTTLTTAWGPLSPGQSMALPDNCDLADFYAAVSVDGEGVLISYTD